jgi:Carboxypeptidase regulatory-like domain
MLTIKSFARLFVFLLVATGVTAAAHAQTSVGTVEGTVSDEQGAVLPGATATLTGPQGAQTAVTDGKGQYRFLSVQPGTYRLKLELGTGFTAQTREVTVGLGKTSLVDVALKIASRSETVEVRGAAPTVDVRSSSTDTSVSQNMLQMTPLYSSTSTGLLNAAPGITSSSAFGGQGGIGNALLLDGVDTRDPEGGTAWAFFNQNLIEELQIGGLGATAEYGGFTGAVVNTVTKSGGNAFSGLFSLRYTDKGLSSQNISAAQLALNKNLGTAAVLKKLKDYTVQMGGPIKQNKAFFFASIQRYSALSDPTGPVANQQDISPRVNLKVTLQPTAHDTVILGAQYDNYNLTGRVGYWPAAQATDRQTVEEDSPEWVWNAQWRRSFGGSALLETKLTGYNGYYYLDPIDPSPFTYDGGTNTYSGGGGGQYYADRKRNQLQVSLTQYAQKFGSHSFKFGAEIERSHVRSQYQPYGPAGFYLYQYDGVPYYRVAYGYDVQGDNHRTSAYAQDQWSAGRATLNIGLRLDHIRGYSPVLKETVYKPSTAWGPRVGLAYKVTSNDTAALKAYWGRLYEGTATTIFTAATPGIQDYTHTPVNDAGVPNGPSEVIVPAQIYSVGQDMKHPYTDEFNLSYEQQLMRGMRLITTGIWRQGGNFLNNVIADARWSPRTLSNPLTGQSFTGYSWVNQSASNESFTITNTGGFQYINADGSVVGTLDPHRTYKGLMLVLTNSLRGRLGYQLSYVLSKAEGTVDNSGTGAYFSGSGFTSPNTTLINADGELTNSRRHEVKAYFTYRIPRVDVMVGGNYTGLSGRHFTPSQVYSSSLLSVGSSSRRTIFLEPRGTEENDFIHQVDLRVEKVIQIQGQRFGLYADTINLFNANAATTRQATYPSSGGIAYKAPTAIQGARQITFGGRWSF